MKKSIPVPPRRLVRKMISKPHAPRVQPRAGSGAELGARLGAGSGQFRPLTAHNPAQNPAQNPAHNSAPQPPARPPPEFATLVHGLWDLLKSPEFKACILQKRVPQSRAFYDGEHGLRMIIVTPTYWGEAWTHSKTCRRASIHTAFLEEGVVFEWDSERRAGRIVKSEGWPDDLNPMDFTL